MRNTFINEVYNLAGNDESIYLMTGDLGFGVLDKFKNDYPNRFINAGISEQNMTSMAAGMAVEGKKVVTYSIGNFSTMRCLEQIRNDVAYHQANVKIVAIGCGFSYGALGMSHHSTEDIAIMRALPGMTIFSPSDSVEAREVAKNIFNVNGPCYIRLSKGGEKTYHNEDFTMQIGQAYKLIDGDDTAIFVTGSILEEVIEAVNKLNNLGIHCSVYTFPTIKPINVECVQEICKKFSTIFTVEEHNIIGGFGSAISEIIAENCYNVRQVRIGINDVYASVVGNQKYLRDYYNISSKYIELSIQRNIDRIKR
ncbi:MAG: transketolase [Clostridiales bacterium]|nr:transketolase [Clostridiales bacterium]